ncbi:aldehyde dehydrogenase (NAD+) [Fodinibius salinus]|uniref:Aldehyde dehydrogenase n=1 Tax=Fodinibius salinus TaxID=860790 RepID=A0A5D3YJE2_9BACT|nr:aldehyde dehydrogenase [Fodinibius salinus]TYP93893.1 aldehyde dehydrogenase (NAD+) [Fodinibius salinus]
MEEIVNIQQQFFKQGHTRDVDFRKEQLRKIKKLLNTYEDDIFDALFADLKKPVFETYETELLILKHEIDHLLSNLSSWASPTKVSGEFFNFPSQNYIHPQPYGVSLVIGAWNYPLQLSLNPALSSIAAGNTTIIKPSEHASHTSRLVTNMINENFEAGFLHAIEGDAEVTQSLLDQPLDYIFFTGSTTVGKKIMHAAAKQLTPLTLELGGKSPAIVDQSADIATAAKRICWGKFINAGQTCVSPDYVYVHKSLKKTFLQHLKEYVTEFYGDDPSQSPDYARIINRNHFSRITGLLEDQSEVIGGQYNEEDLYIEPTILPRADWNHSVMQEEIFGPLLPVLPFADLDDVITTINSHSRPLALYLFSTDSDNQEKIINEIPFGGGCINDTVAHLANLNLPFGGIGNSGFGQYHGKSGFDEFSHQKSIMKKSGWPQIPLRYPPYEGNLKWLKKFTDLL